MVDIQDTMELKHKILTTMQLITNNIINNTTINNTSNPNHPLQTSRQQVKKDSQIALMQPQQLYLLLIKQQELSNNTTKIITTNITSSITQVITNQLQEKVEHTLLMAMMQQQHIISSIMEAMVINNNNLLKVGILNNMYRINNSSHLKPQIQLINNLTSEESVETIDDMMTQQKLIKVKRKIIELKTRLKTGKMFDF